MKNGTPVSSDPSYTFAATANRTLVATFSLKQYNVSVAAAPSEGGAVSGGGTFNHGETATVVATANSGYGFAGWSENGTIVSSNLIYSFTVTADRTLLANFTLNQFTISVSANPAAGGTVSGGGTFDNGQSVTVVASANEGYTFVGWSENGSTVSTDLSYTLAATADHVLVANFAAKQYTISTTANPTAGRHSERWRHLHPRAKCHSGGNCQ